LNSTLKKWLSILLTLSMLAPALLYAQAQIQGPRNSPDVYSGVVYGPIDQSDTLWRIASRYKQDSEFSVYQTMLAIYELNPQAFENQNFNTMVNGATLRLPSDRFIARMDVQRARAKAEADDRAFGRQNSVQPEQSEIESESAADEVNNLKPEVPLVNQEDLSATQRQLQNQLNSLNRQQTAQFNQIKEQVSASMSNVQALIDENRKVYERLDQVNQDISDLRAKVEGEVQDQIDQQLALQKELIELVKQAEQRQLEKEAESIFTTLSSPLAIITLSSIFTAGILVILGLFLLRRPKKQQSEPTQDEASKDIVDDELVIGEMEDDFDSDAEDLMAALEEDMDDDILSSELEDGLDELGVDEDEFAEIDEMLVPDTNNVKDEEPDDQAHLDEVDDEFSFDTDAIGLDEDDFANQEIDLKPKDAEQVDEQKKTIEDVTESLDLDDIASEAESESNIEALQELASVSEAEEKEKIAEEKPEQKEGEVFDGLEDSDAPSRANKLAASGTAMGVALDESADVNEESLKQIEESINETTEEFEKLSSEILDELKNGPAEVAASELESVGEESSDAVAVSDETDDLDLEAEAEAETDAQVGAEEEIEADGKEEAEDADEQTGAQRSDIEDALVEKSGPEDVAHEALEVAEDGLLDEDFEDSADDGLADELLGELEEEQASEELDSLLDEFTQKPDAFEGDETDEERQNDTEEQPLDLGDGEQEPDDAANQLADELLSELDDNDNVDNDDLDALLEEFTQDTPAAETSDLARELEETPEKETQASDSAGSDALLGDIPSFSPTENATKTEAEISPEVAANETAPQDPKETSADEPEDEEDVLADLPGLDDWLEDDGYDKDIKNIESNGADKTELDVLADIESSDFDDLLSEIDADNIETTIKEIDEASNGNAPDDPLLSAGLDLDALMLDDDEPESSVEDFINVDDLLSESEGLTPLEDDELALDLDNSLPKMNSNNSQSSAGGFEQENTDQASNLDLAQVYIDMDDLDAAKEILLEVQAKGSDEQMSEAMQLLQQISDKS
jgi:pilus assembly protein FimV